AKIITYKKLINVINRYTKGVYRHTISYRKSLFYSKGFVVRLNSLFSELTKLDKQVLYIVIANFKTII
ncbi:MAG: hypothetical protein ACXW0J_06070, partial [Nitrososphaeraceae archaeon]